MQTVPGTLEPMGFQQITSLATAAALTVPAGARVARIQAEAQHVRWRDDGVNPTATVGMRLLTTSDGLLYQGDLSKIRFIEEAVGARLNVTYYR